jgi:O-methyltransferase
MNDSLRNLLRPIYRTLVQKNPLVQSIVRRESTSGRIIDEFVDGDSGAEYGITASQRRELVSRFFDNTKKIKAATNPIQHVILAQEILAVPRSSPGDVVECGVFKGASSASLSLVCEMVGRRLLVCDSFAGLPDDDMQLHVAAHGGIYGFYKSGMFCGSLDEVKSNIERCGAPNVCEYVVGFFSESLRSLNRPIAFAFLDVDLVSSTQDCLRVIWPLLNDNCAIYTDDAGDLDCVKVFFDDAWWKNTLGCAAPGFVGSGCGLPFSSACASMGYVRKVSNPELQFKRAEHLCYPDEGNVANPKDAAAIEN